MMNNRAPKPLYPKTHTDQSEHLDKPKQNNIENGCDHKKWVHKKRVHIKLCAVQGAFENQQVECVSTFTSIPEWGRGQWHLGVMLTRQSLGRGVYGKSSAAMWPAGMHVAPSDINPFLQSPKCGFGGWKRKKKKTFTCCSASDGNEVDAAEWA